MPTCCFSTRYGWVAIAATPDGLGRVTLPQRSRHAALAQLPPNERSTHALRRIHILRLVERKLKAYYSGKSVDFAEIPLDFKGATRFQLAVWRTTRKIPYGKTRAYSDVARELGRPNAARAVGQCMASNRFPILVPCHRLVGRSGDLRGFGGGLSMKRALLQMEGAI